MFLCFVKSEINFLAITTWENEDVMRKWDVVFCSNRFQAQLVAVSSEGDSDQWEGLSEPQWPMRGWQVTHSDAWLPGDCSNSDNNLSWVWGRVMAGDNVNISHRSLLLSGNWDQQRSWPRPGPSYWYSNVVLTVKYYFHKIPCDHMWALSVTMWQCIGTPRHGFTNIEVHHLKGSHTGI